MEPADTDPGPSAATMVSRLAPAPGPLTLSMEPSDEDPGPSADEEAEDVPATASSSMPKHQKTLQTKIEAPRLQKKTAPTLLTKKQKSPPGPPPHQNQAPDHAPEVTTPPDFEVGYFDVPGFPENPYSKRAKLDHV